MLRRRDSAHVRAAERSAEGRLTQAERSAATRARLLDATIDCLVELGWSGTSTTEVVRRAGVSRGAQVHHYPSKEELVVAAVEHLCTRRMQEYRAVLEGLSPEQRTSTASIDLLWSIWSGPTLEAWLEVTIAARTQPGLRERFVAFERRFFDAALALFRETQPELASDPAIARLVMRFTFSVLDGLAMGRLAGVDKSELDEVVDAFKVVAAAFDPMNTVSPWTPGVEES
jgi:AcrR family transcriptional regulator